MGRTYSNALAVLLAALLAGCASGALVERPAGLPFVSISNGGAFGGGTSSEMFADGTLIFSSWEPFSDPTEIQRKMPPENFESAKEIAEAAIRDIPASDERSCEDFGATTIALYDASGQISSSISTGCPDQDYFRTIQSIRKAMSSSSSVRPTPVGE